MDISKEIFRKYDIRGLAGKELDEDFAFVLGMVLAGDFQNLGSVLLGYDSRLSSRACHDALALGLLRGGADVVSLGMIPSPCLYFAMRHLGRSAGVMVTASHNPAEYNGFKIWLGQGTLCGEEIFALRGKMLEAAHTLEAAEFVKAAAPGKNGANDDSCEKKRVSAPEFMAETAAAPAKGLYAKELRKIWELRHSENFSRGFLSFFDILPAYKREVLRRFPLENSPHDRADPKRVPERATEDIPARTRTTPRVVVDGGNGAAGMLCCDILRALGAEVIPLYCEPDGHFPHHPPDPIEAANSRDLCARVLECGADAGFGLDGDGDRLAVADGNGRLLPADVLLSFFVHDFFLRRTRSGEKSGPYSPGQTPAEKNTEPDLAASPALSAASPVILADVKCSQQLFREVEALGGRAVMCATGHSLMRRAMREEGAVLGGELAGHFFHAENWHGFDDACFGAAKVLHILTHSSLTLESFPLWPKVFSTPERRFACPESDKEKLLNRVREHFRALPASTVDGLRVNVKDGWFLVRASNTGPYLSLRFEAGSKERLAELQREVFSVLET